MPWAGDERLAGFAVGVQVLEPQVRAGAQPLSPSRGRFAAIHAEAPEFVEMSVEQEILVTGIKVVDLLAPYAKGGKIGRLGVSGEGGIDSSAAVSFTDE